jgi:hypothetical protein
VVAPAGVLVGVDLVPVERVGSRHAGAILGCEEWEALAPYPAVRPALAWALKEAAAKAMGDPLRRFPHGIRIEAGSGGVILTALESETIEFAAGWGMFDGFLYAWVRGKRRVVPAIVILSEAKEPCPCSCPLRCAQSDRHRPGTVPWRRTGSTVCPESAGSLVTLDALTATRPAP